MSDIKLKNIQQACLYGIRKSFNEYAKWNNARLSHAPEYLLNINIAKQLSEEYGDKYISLEENVKDIVQELKIEGNEDFSKNIRIQGKFDIVIWSLKKDRPKGIIEVKQNINGFRNIRKDIDRIVSLLKQNSKIKFGISTFFIDYQKKVNSKEKLIKKIEEIHIELQKHASGIEIELDFQEILTESIKNDSEEYSAFAVVLTLKKAK